MVKKTNELSTFNIGLRCEIKKLYGIRKFLEIKAGSETIAFDNCIVGLSNGKLVYDLNEIYGVYKDHTNLRGNSMERELARVLPTGINSPFVFINMAHNAGNVKLTQRIAFENLSRHNMSWDDMEIKYIIDNPDMSYRELGNVLCRTAMSVCVKKVEMRKAGILPESKGARRKAGKAKAKCAKAKPVRIAEEKLFAVQTSKNNYEIVGNSECLNSKVRKGDINVGAKVFEVQIKPAYVVKPGLSKL